MSILVDILTIILGLTLVFGGLVGWLIKLAISRKKNDSSCLCENSKRRVAFYLEKGDHDGNI